MSVHPTKSENHCLEQCTILLRVGAQEQQEAALALTVIRRGPRGPQHRSTPEYVGAFIIQWGVFVILIAVCEKKSEHYCWFINRTSYLVKSQFTLTVKKKKKIERLFCVRMTNNVLSLLFTLTWASLANILSSFCNN